MSASQVPLVAAPGGPRIGGNADLGGVRRHWNYAQHKAQSA